MLSNVLEWQQTHEGPIQIKCEDSLFIQRSCMTAQHSLRMRARLRRSGMTCDRNGNNLLMIAPNNHLPFRKLVFIDILSKQNKQIKTEHEDSSKDKDDETQKKEQNGD